MSTHRFITTRDAHGREYRVGFQQRGAIWRPYRVEVSIENRGRSWRRTWRMIWSDSKAPGESALNACIRAANVLRAEGIEQVVAYGEFAEMCRSRGEPQEGAT